MTNWENIVSGKELITAKNKRKNLYIEARERKVALEELEEEGWEYVKDYADSKFVKVRKEKPFYERFEDQIWLLFFQMGFKHLNRDANFKMNYDFNNPDFTQQIDVFAADDETILIVECKSSEDLNEVQFKKDIEKLHGQYRLFNWHCKNVLSFLLLQKTILLPLMVALTLVIIKRLSIDSIHFLKVVLRQSKMNAKQNGR